MKRVIQPVPRLRMSPDEGLLSQRTVAPIPKETSRPPTTTKITLTILSTSARSQKDGVSHPACSSTLVSSPVISE